MLLPCCSSTEMGSESLHCRFLPPSHYHSTSQLRPRASLGFSLYKQKISRTQVSFLCTPFTLPECDGILKSCTYKGKTGGSVGFKFRCHSTTTLPSKPRSLNGRKNKYGGALPSILRSLESGNEIENTLSSLCGNLSPKEQTVILKEQRVCERLIQVWDFFKSQKDYLPNVIHYNIVLRSLGRAQKWDDLRRCWIEMAKNGVLPTNNTYGMLVDVYGKAGLVKEALLWIKHMKLRRIFPDEVTMNTVVRVLKDAGEFDRADKFYKDWCTGWVELDDLTFDSIVGSENGLDLAEISYKHFLSTELFKTGGRPKSVASAEVEGTLRKPSLTSTYNTLIDLYGKAGRLEDAAGVFSEMLRSGVAMDTITFNTMIFTCGSHGHLSEAEALLEDMESRGISPDTKTYNVLLSLYADLGNIDAALDCYRKIPKVGLLPDVVTYRAVIHILCKRNMVQEVGVVIEEMEKSGTCIDANSLPVVTKMYVDAGLLNQAKDLLERFQKEHELSSKVRAAVMDALAEKGLWAEAESMFLAKRKSVGQKKDVLEYNVMIKAYGMARRYEKAFSLFKSMKDQGTWPDECTFNSLIQMLAGGDLVEAARNTLAEMQRAGFKPHCLTFSAVIACYARLGLLSDAVDVYREMEIQGVKPNEVVYGSLINGFAEVGRVDEALQYFRWMRECGISANRIVLTSLIKAYGMMGSVEAAKSVYERMKSMEGGLDTIASNSIINLYADLDMVSEAKLVFEDMLEKGWADAISFATMMRLYKNMRMLDEAIEVAEEMKQAGLLRDCDSYNEVMACYAEDGMLLECGDLLYEMINRKILPDSGTFKVIFTLLKKAGMAFEAVDQLESSYQEGKPYARLAIISSVFSAVGLQGRARGSCETILKVKAALHSSIYNACIYVLGALGETDRALNVLMKMQDVGFKPDLVTFIHLVVCYGKGGMIEGVKRIHNLIKRGDIEPKESLVKAVIEAYRNVNRRDLAELVSRELSLTSDQETEIRTQVETSTSPLDQEDWYSDSDADDET